MAHYFDWDVAPTSFQPPAGLVGTVRTGQTWQWPAGRQVGDLAYIYCMGNGTFSRAGWTQLPTRPYDGASGTSRVSGVWKVLTASDIAAAPPDMSISFGFKFLFVFRGVTSMLERTRSPRVVSSTFQNVDIPGITKDAASQLLLVTQNSWSYTAYPTMAIPVGFTEINGSGGVQNTLAARINMKQSSQYVDNTPITVNLMAAQQGAEGILYELLA